MFIGHFPAGIKRPVFILYLGIKYYDVVVADLLYGEYARRQTTLCPKTTLM